MSRFTKRLGDLAAMQAERAPQAELQRHMQVAGDELEFAARVAEAAWQAREKRVDESDVFRLGYATASLELAVVLRAMRKGGQPTEEAMREARREALALSMAEPQPGETEPAGDG